MPNAKDYKDDTFNKILISSPVGCGKTTQFLTFPGRKFIYCFDHNALGALKGHEITYEQFLATKLNITVRPIPKGGASTTPAQSGETRLKAQAYAQFEAHLMKSLDDGYFDSFDSIGLDSLTTLQDIALYDIQAREGRLDQPPHQDDYNLVKIQLSRIILTFCALDKPLLITAHTMYKQSELSSKMLEELIVPGMYKYTLPIPFDSHFRADYTINGDKKRFFLQSVKDNKNETLKSNIPGISGMQDVTIEDFNYPERYGIGKLLAEAKRNTASASTVPSSQSSN